MVFYATQTDTGDKLVARGCIAVTVFSFLPVDSVYSCASALIGMLGRVGPAGTVWHVTFTSPRDPSFPDRELFELYPHTLQVRVYS